MESIHLTQISFSQLIEYWKEVNHFEDPGKVYTEVISQLGPYQSSYTNPRRLSYGLMKNDRLIAATHLAAWNEETVRFRTVNVRKEYRNQNLGWRLLSGAIELDWSSSKYLFGWVRRNIYHWARARGFHELDGCWQDHHIGMFKHIQDQKGIVAPQIMAASELG